jgi:hypothetical protein
MEWTLRLVGMGIDGQSRSVDVMAIARPEGLGETAYLGLSLAEAKQLLSQVQQAVVAAQADRHAMFRPDCQSCGRMVDEQIGLPRHVGLEAAKHTGHLGRRHGGGCFPFRHDVERFQGVADQIEGSLHLAVPQAPASTLVDNIRETGAFLAIFGGGVWPAFDRLGDVLNAH